MLGFDKALGIHPTMVSLRARRAGVLATNMANADTPNYKARDVDFSGLLNKQISAKRLATSNAGHLPLGSANLLGAELMYRNPLQASIDNNTVEIDVERAKFMDNAMRYQASMRFLDGKFSSLRAALRGE